MDRIKVSVIANRQRGYYLARWPDPLTGKSVRKSTGVKIGRNRSKERSQAERIAAQIEAELNAGTYREPSKATWGELCERFIEEHAGGLARATKADYRYAFNNMERVAGFTAETRLTEVTQDRYSRFIAAVRKEGAAEATLGGFIRCMNKAFKWGSEVGLMQHRPKLQQPKRDPSRQQLAGGRAITGEEFDRMLAAMPKIVGEKAAASWDFYLWGIWWGGFRLGESLKISWDEDDKPRVVLSGQKSVLAMPGRHEKGNKNRLMPLAPEFVRHLETVPEKNRRGRVFRPRGRSGRPADYYKVSKLAADIGRAAGIITGTNEETGEPKFASLHDLRRSFAERWARKVPAVVLQRLMRHQSLATTQKYYLTGDAEADAAMLWAAAGDPPKQTAPDQPADAP